MRLVLAALLFMGLVSAGQAQDSFSDPKALVTAIYAGYQPGQTVPDPSIFYSKRLAGLVAQRQQDVVAETASISATNVLPSSGPFNPFLPDAHAFLYDLVIGEPTQLGNTALVNVSYHNFDQPRLLSLALVREDGGWRVDDVTSVGPNENWLLSWVLTYDPQGF